MNIFNKARGECAININGSPQKLCLTLGALAELETAFAADNMAHLAQKMGKLSAKDFLIVLAILLKGGGKAIGLEDLAAAQIDTKEAVIAISKTIAIAFGE